MTEQNAGRIPIQDRIKAGNFRGVVTAPEFATLTVPEQIHAIISAIDVKRSIIAEHADRYANRADLLSELNMAGHALSRAFAIASQGGLGTEEMGKRIREEIDHLFKAARVPEAL